MEAKDWVTLVGVAVTLGLGIYNFILGQRSARRVSIVGAVTAQRLKWGEEIQDLISSFCGATHYVRFSVVKGTDEERKKIEEIDRLRHRIPLNLCERTQIELKIEQCMKTIASMSSGRLAVSDEDFRAKLDELVRTTQDLLHDNWISVASEAHYGAYAPRSGLEIQDPATDTSGSMRKTQ
jgi:hypothetical protein